MLNHNTTPLLMDDCAENSVNLEATCGCGHFDKAVPYGDACIDGLRIADPCVP